MIEFEKVTTRGGDRGETNLSNGERRRKDDLLFDTLGAVDELTSFLGVVRAILSDRKAKKTILDIQERLLTIGTQAATPHHDPLYKKLKILREKDLRELEQTEQALLKRTEVPDKFILPGDDILSAHIDVARTVCRRAERRIVSCIRDRGMIHLALCQNYLNRLSDFLFVLARSRGESQESPKGAGTGQSGKVSTRNPGRAQ